MILSTLGLAGNIFFIDNLLILFNFFFFFNENIRTLNNLVYTG